MEIALAAGVLYTAYNLSVSTPNNTEKRKQVPEKEKISGENIYESNRIKKVDDYVREQARKSFEASRNVMETNKVPPFMNSMCWAENGCELNTNKPLQAGSNILPALNDKGVLDTDQFNKRLFGTAGDGSANANALMEFDDREFFISKLSGEKTRKTHNNMVPFFKGNELPGGQSDGVKNNILEKFTGREKNYTPKKEMADFQVKQKQEINGNKDITDIKRVRTYQSRFINNVLPTPQVKVKPLPAEIVRPQPKNVDQLRAKSNPKKVYSGRAIKGANKSQSQRGEIGIVMKNLPDNTRDYEYSVPGSVLKAQKDRGNFVARDNSRSQKQDYISPAQNHITKVRQNYVDVNQPMTASSEPTTASSDPMKRNYLNQPFRNIQSIYQYVDDYGKSSINLPQQERETTNYDGREKSSINSVKKNSYSALTDKARTTNKETVLFKYQTNPQGLINAEKDRTHTQNIRQNNRDELSDRRGYKSGPTGQTTSPTVDDVHLTKVKNNPVFNETYNMGLKRSTLPVQNREFGAQNVDKSKLLSETDFTSRNKSVDDLITRQRDSNPYAIKRFSS